MGHSKPARKGARSGRVEDPYAGDASRARRLLSSLARTYPDRMHVVVSTLEILLARPPLHR